MKDITTGTIHWDATYRMKMSNVLDNSVDRLDGTMEEEGEPPRRGNEMPFWPICPQREGFFHKYEVVFKKFGVWEEMNEKQSCKGKKKEEEEEEEEEGEKPEGEEGEEEEEDTEQQDEGVMGRISGAIKSLASAPAQVMKMFTGSMFGGKKKATAGVEVWRRAVQPRRGVDSSTTSMDKLGAWRRRPSRRQEILRKIERTSAVSGTGGGELITIPTADVVAAVTNVMSGLGVHGFKGHRQYKALLQAPERPNILPASDTAAELRQRFANPSFLDVDPAARTALRKRLLPSDLTEAGYELRRSHGLKAAFPGLHQRIHGNNGVEEKIHASNFLMNPMEIKKMIGGMTNLGALFELIGGGGKTQCGEGDEEQYTSRANDFTDEVGRMVISESHSVGAPYDHTAIINWIAD